MNFWMLTQIIFDIVALTGFVAVWVKLSRPAKDDPRMSRGLQLLQTKISVLEDLSDRTETQVSQLTALMEHKVKEIQGQILNADKTLQKIDASVSKSLEVAKIFQDRIPHQEIVERQNTIKYVKAARMAHQGSSIEEISQQVDLPRGEIEFIAKVNKNQLQFSVEDLPEWVRGEDASAATPEPSTIIQEASAPAAESAPSAPAQTQIAPQPLAKQEDRMTLSDLGDRFRQAISVQSFVAPNIALVNSANVILDKKPESLILDGQNTKGEKIQVRKVVFRKVDSNSDLS